MRTTKEVKMSSIAKMTAPKSAKRYNERAAKRQKVTDCTDALRRLSIDVAPEIAYPLVVWKKPPQSRRGKLKCPAEFPRFQCKSFMLVVWSTEELMKDLYKTLFLKQHTFFGENEYFQGLIVQGEYATTGKPHLQLAINFTASTHSTQIWKAFAAWAVAPESLQLIKAESRKDAWHYCGKPHNKCDCEHCEKARLCKVNWATPLICGTAPVGKGNKFGSFIKAIKENPTKKVMVENFGKLYGRYSTGMEKIRNYYHTQKNERDFMVYPSFLSNFQMALVINEVWNEQPRASRRMIWWWSERLRTGKSLMVSWLRYLNGPLSVSDGVHSYKHYVHAYEGETFTHFNFAKTEDPTENARLLALLEVADDGGWRQAPHYDAKKNYIDTRVIVTANVGPPPVWLGEEGRIYQEVCFDPPKTTGEPSPPLPHALGRRNFSFNEVLGKRKVRGW